MAKKKKRKEDKTKKFAYTNELYGVCFILLAILGIGIGSPLGIVGKLVKAFSVFLFGTWNIVFMIALFVIGTYMIIKREKPLFFTSHLVGLYIIFIGILVYSHLNYVSLNEGDILSITKLLEISPHEWWIFIFTIVIRFIFIIIYIYYFLFSSSSCINS